jgi:uncharacterized membrane protein
MEVIDMAYCNKCGTQVQDGVNFCPSCGTPMGVAPGQQGSGQGYAGGSYPPPQYGGYAGQWESPEADVRDNKPIAILAYFFSVIILIVVLCSDKKHSRFAKYHANQAILLAIFAAGGFIVLLILFGILGALAFTTSFGFFSVITGLGSLLYGALSILITVLLILGVVNAANGQMKPLPIFGKINLLK